MEAENPLYKAILLSGCTSPRRAIVAVYLLSISYRNSTAIDPQRCNNAIQAALSGMNSSLEVRTGYFGICAISKGTQWVCANDASTLAEFFSGDNDPWGLIQISANFKQRVVLPWFMFVLFDICKSNTYVPTNQPCLGSVITIIIATSCIVTIGTFPGWREEIDPSGSIWTVLPCPSLSLTNSICIGIFLAALLQLISALWQHASAVAYMRLLQDIACGQFETGTGTVAMPFAWVIFGVMVFSFLSTLPLIV